MSRPKFLKGRVINQEGFLSIARSKKDDFDFHPFRETQPFFRGFFQSWIFVLVDVYCTFGEPSGYSSLALTECFLAYSQTACLSSTDIAVRLRFTPPALSP